MLTDLFFLFLLLQRISSEFVKQSETDDTHEKVFQQIRVRLCEGMYFYVLMHTCISIFVSRQTQLVVSTYLYPSGIFGITLSCRHQWPLIGHWRKFRLAQKASKQQGHFITFTQRMLFLSDCSWWLLI